MGVRSEVRGVSRQMHAGMATSPHASQASAALRADPGEPRKGEVSLRQPDATARGKRMHHTRHSTRRVRPRKSICSLRERAVHALILSLARRITTKSELAGPKQLQSARHA